MTYIYTHVYVLMGMRLVWDDWVVQCIYMCMYMYVCRIVHKKTLNLVTNTVEPLSNIFESKSSQ